MTRTVLLTLGRLPKGLELARCLAGAGWRVIVAEPMAIHLCRGSRAVAKCYRVPAPARDPAGYRDALLSIIAKEGVDLVAPVSEEVVHVAEVAAAYEGPATFMVPPLPTLLRLHDKVRFAAWAADCGLNAPPTAAGASEAAAAIMAQGEYVVKPAQGCAGTGLFFGAPGQAPPVDLTPDMAVQRRIRGDEVSTFSLVRDGVVLGTVVYRGRVLLGTVAVAFERCEGMEAVEGWVRDFAGRSGYSGFIAFDMIVDRDGEVWPIECNPRLTSGIHFLAHDALAKGVAGEPGAALTMKRPMRLQEGHTTLALAYANIARPLSFLRRIGAVFSTADVKWSWRDPVPFLFFTTLSAQVLWRMMRRRVRLADAVTQDLEWNGPAPVPSAHEARTGVGRRA